MLGSSPLEETGLLHSRVQCVPCTQAPSQGRLVEVRSSWLPLRLGVAFSHSANILAPFPVPSIVLSSEGSMHLSLSEAHVQASSTADLEQWWLLKQREAIYGKGMVLGGRI